MPKDAEGHEIPLDTTTLYDENGNEYEVYYYKYSVRQTIPQRKWQVVMMDCIVHDVSDLYLTPPDSWEQLEEDLNRAVEETNICMYFSESGTCLNCAIRDTRGGCSPKVLEHILDRIRELRSKTDE